MDCKKNENLGMCNCTYPCSRKGLCCECIAHHRKKGELPACYFPADAEKTYNRSIEYYLEISKN
ncbi:MAG TPA: DUF6485 family protein [Salinivirga sp.]|uniref:Cytosolic protein n=1 Tax=Salinivirga cyanobacteriivorans TaxID=1307839 RepID=A0A0S2HVT2_9BACT|nr:MULTISPECIES: DUF6485 family protein [Salinivirga]ALO14145.1 hypothetical protein L21SP5_00469 [Salinivirga cyanobacteriivorans]HKK59999.1 DUF6485 family protein [Salinivirga sp.]